MPNPARERHSSVTGFYYSTSSSAEQIAQESLHGSTVGIPDMVLPRRYKTDGESLGQGPYKRQSGQQNSERVSLSKARVTDASLLYREGIRNLKVRTSVRPGFEKFTSSDHSCPPSHSVELNVPCGLFQQ